jgi:PAS domain S-box-containing protein
MKLPNALKIIMDASPIGCVVFDHEAIAVYANHVAQQLFGNTEETLIGGKCGNFIGCHHRHAHPRGCGHTANCPACPLNQAIQAVLAGNVDPGTTEGTLAQGGSNLPHPWLKFKASGIVLDGRTAVVVAMDARGRFERANGISQDRITDGWIAGKELRVSEKKYREIFENAPVGIFQTTPQGRFLSANPEYARMAGYSNPSEMIGQVSDIAAQLYVRPEERDRYKALLQRNGQVMHYEVELKRNDGSTFWVSMNTKALKNRDGSIVYDGFLTDVSERVRAEQALRNAEALHRKMVAHIGDVIVIIDREGINRYKSPNIEKWFGWKPEEVVGADTLENIHPEDKHAAQQFLQSLLAEPNATRTAQCRYRCKDGSYKWIEFTGIHLLHDPDIQGILGNYHDITDRKLAEDALRESERHLQQVFDILPVGLWFADKDGTLLKGNPAGIKIWGAEPLVDYSRYGVFKARRFPSGEPIAPNDWSLYRTIRNRVTIVDELLEIEAFDGKKKIILNSTAPVLDEQGGVQGAIIVNQDITERKQAEADLKRIEWMLSKKPPSANEVRAEAHDQGYGDLTELNKEGAIIELIGPELLQSFASDYLELLGTSSAIYEASGDYALGIFASGWCRMMDRASRELCDTADNVKALQSGKWLCHESCWTCCAKEAIAKRSPMDIACHGGIRLYGVPILAGGEVAGVINFGYGDPPKDPARLRQLAKAYHLDYDDLIREARAYDSRPPYIIEMAKSRLHASARLIGSILEAKLAEKAREKLQDQLTQSRKMESVGRLAGGVAHDFNNMLSVILGHTEMALEQVSPDDPLFDDLQEINKSARRSADLTRQLLAFARKQTVAPRVLDLSATVQEMHRMLRRLIGEQIQLVWQPGSDLWPVKMDPSQLDQILANLCVNARDAIAGGMGTITIAAENIALEGALLDEPDTPVSGDYVRLSVMDDGCGMDQQTLVNIFEPFFTTKPTGEGTGLGLATVFGIVKQNAGFVQVRSAQGQGTTFILYLPRHVMQAVQPATPTPTTPARAHGSILVVEDEPSILSMTVQMLERQGYTALGAATPGEALRVAREHSGDIDLLMTDVIMPEMHGRELANNMLVLYPGIKRLFMSGYTADVIAEHGVLEEDFNFIQKPFSMKELGDKIRSVLDDQ